MALNVEFQGNVYDESGTAIDCVFKCYHRESGNWSEQRNTDIQQYSVNLGDGDLDTQNGSANAGDKVLIMFESTEIDPVERIFCSYEITLTNASIYIQNVQLRGCTAPVIENDWYVRSTTDNNATFLNPANGNANTHIGRVDDTITAVSNFNDNSSWSYDTVTLKHYGYVLGQDIFTDRLGIVLEEMDWTEDDVFVTDKTHVFLEKSQGSDESQVVKIKATNRSGFSTTAEKFLQIRYKRPVLSLAVSHNNPSVLDNFVATSSILDIHATITNIDYLFDGALLATNLLLDYDIVPDLGSTYIATRTARVNVEWYDGFSGQTTFIERSVSMTNLPPVFDVTYTSNGEGLYKFYIANAVDPDGDDAEMNSTFSISYKVPIANNYITIYNDAYPTPKSLDVRSILLPISGQYIITTIVKDEFGLTSSVESVVDVVLNNNTAVVLPKFYFDWE